MARRCCDICGANFDAEPTYVRAEREWLAACTECVPILRLRRPTRRTQVPCANCGRAVMLDGEYRIRRKPMETVCDDCLDGVRPRGRAQPRTARPL